MRYPRTVLLLVVLTASLALGQSSSTKTSSSTNKSGAANKSTSTTSASGAPYPAITKNIVSDFGCGCNGTGSDNAAFTAFNTWALSWQASHSGLIELVIPSGATAMLTVSGETGWFAKGIKQLLVSGYGATFSDGGSGNAFWLGGYGVAEDNLHSARVATVTAGASSITLVTPSQSSLFTVGSWALMAGVDLQGFGYPPNPAFHDYVQISSINSGTGVITFTAPLQYSYESTWPVYEAGDSSDTDLGGAATLYALDPSWNTSVEYDGLTFNTSGQTVSVGRQVTYKGITCVGGGSVYPTMDLSWSLVNASMPTSNIEMDKIVTNVSISGSTIKSIDFQSSSIDNFTMTSSVISNYLHGGPKNATISNCTIQQLEPGAWGYGASAGMALSNCTINSPIAPLGADGSGLGTYTIRSGVLTVPNSAGPQHWAVPGASVYLTGGQANEYSLTVVDLSQDSTNTYIQTSLSGGYPTIPGSSSTFVAYPATTFTCSGCSGDPTAVDASLAPSGNTFFSYANRTLTRSNIGTSQPVIPVWGNLISLSVNVITPYTGVQSTLTLNIGPGGVLVQNSSGAFAVYQPTFNLKVAGLRTITPTGVTGAQSGDSITAPGSGTRLYDDELQLYCGTNIGSESSSVYPTVQLIVVTTGGFPQ
ncbi:MAG TPA: hypothetical protein VI756_08755 [Blastocatellia bacterium]